MGQLDPSPPRQVVVDPKLLLEFKRLVASIGLSAAAPHCRRAKVGDAVVLHPRKVRRVVVVLLLQVLLLGRRRLVVVVLVVVLLLLLLLLRLRCRQLLALQVVLLVLVLHEGVLRLLLLLVLVQRRLRVRGRACRCRAPLHAAGAVAIWRRRRRCYRLRGRVVERRGGRGDGGRRKLVLAARVGGLVYQLELLLGLLLLLQVLLLQIAG